MYIFKAIYLMILSLGVDFSNKICLRQGIVEDRVDSPFEAEIREKLQKVSASDKVKAIGILSDHFGNGFPFLVNNFENKRSFQRIILSESKLKSLMLSLAERLPSHSAQKVVLLLLIAVSTVSELDSRRIGVVDIHSCLKRFEDEEVMIVSHNNSWAIKTKAGCIWPAIVVERFIK